MNQATKTTSVFILAELAWGDDMYGEDLPVAALYRVTPSTLKKIDAVASMIERGEITSDGAYVAIPNTDTAWLSKLAFNSEGGLAKVPGFFDPEKDPIFYLCDVANIEIDNERADFGDECETYETALCEFTGLRLQSPKDLGLVVSGAGAADDWRASGYLHGWPEIRTWLSDKLIPAPADVVADLVSDPA